MAIVLYLDQMRVNHPGGKMNQPRNNQPKKKVKPEDFARWENEGGNPDPRFIADKNEVQAPKIVEIIRNLLQGLKTVATGLKH